MKPRLAVAAAALAGALMTARAAAPADGGLTGPWAGARPGWRPTAC